MPTPPAAPEFDADKLLFRGVHLDLTPALRSYAERKAARLLRHNAHIVRIRVDLERDKTAAIDEQFIVKGHIEIGGPDLVATAASDDAYKSIDLVVDKLDRLLARRSGQRKERRHRGLADGPAGAKSARK
jgi:putative sigma-54 modulation protein